MRHSPTSAEECAATTREVSPIRDGISSTPYTPRPSWRAPVVLSVQYDAHRNNTAAGSAFVAEVHERWLVEFPIRAGVLTRHGSVRGRIDPPDQWERMRLWHDPVRTSTSMSA